MPENDIIKDSNEEVSPSEVDFDDVDAEIPSYTETATPCDNDADATECIIEKPRFIDSAFEFVELLLLTLVAVFVITTFFFRHSIVDGDSMMNTLQDKDVLIISGLFYTPEQFDIVVIEDHSTDYKYPLVKRVIAVGGDKVRVTEHVITVNGQELDEPYVFTDALNYTYNVYPTDRYFDNPTLVYEEDYYYEFVVPEGEIFVLGDHRNNSADSRTFGTVSTDAVLGKVLFRAFPFSEFGLVDKGEK